MNVTDWQSRPEFQLLRQHSSTARVSAGTVIMREGEEPNKLFFLITGSVAVLMLDEEGRELILAYLSPGEFFGELGLFGEDQRRSAWVRARADCEMAVIGYEPFRALCHMHPELLMWLAGQIATRLRATSRKMGHLAFLDATGRIAGTLLDLARGSEAITHPDGMLVRITREELSRLVSCSREMAGKVLRDLEEQGLIQVQGKNIVVHGAR